MKQVFFLSEPVLILCLGFIAFMSIRYFTTSDSILSLSPHKTRFLFLAYTVCYLIIEKKLHYYAYTGR